MKLEKLKNLAGREWHYDSQSTQPCAQRLKKIDFEWSLLQDYSKKILASPASFEIKLETTRFSSPLSVSLNQAYEEAGYKRGLSEYYEVGTPELNKICQPILKQIPLLNPEVRLFIQTPGQAIPLHVDAYESYSLRSEISYDKIVRHVVFIEDWDWGHYLLIGNDSIHQWQAGDSYRIDRGVWHCSANCGLSPKLTMSITGMRTD